MTSEKRMYRIFKLIRLLNSTPRRTAKQLIQLLETSPSSFYRDIQLLEKLGYPVDTDENDRFFLQLQFERGKKSILEPDELFFLRDHLQQTAANSPQAQALLQKLDLNLSMIPIADSLPQLQQNRLLQLIRMGIETRSCLKICGYRSLSSGRVSDRKVEPLDLSTDYLYLIAWDLEKDRQSQYKLARIQDIEILDEKVDTSRVASPVDLFGLTGEQLHEVRLRLSPIAHHLLVEEFPGARPHIKRRQDEVFFDGQVRNWQGIGRFVLGLPGEIEVLRPEAFKAYLREKAEKINF